MLWEQGLLGDSNPQTLLDTMLFLSGIFFALRSGEEHRSLKLSQFEVVTQDGCDSLIYTENVSKNNQGGLQHRKVKPKSVTCYANEKNSERCLVRFFKAYLSHRPTGTECFYLTPLRKIKGEIWYSIVPVGHNTLSQIVGRLCKQAGISGYKTNHSLRVTSATRLFQNGIDEQLIMSHTGHRSIEGVRSYKRISEEQKKSVSGILSSRSDQRESHKKMNLDVEQDQTITLSSQETNSMTLSHIASTSSTPSFNFSGCSNITINYTCPK